MSAIDQPGVESTASHTLAYLRRIDRRMDGLEKTLVQIVDILGRQDLKIDRSARDTHEGFIRIERDLREIKSDAILADNRILDRFGETLELSRRVNHTEERLDEIEKTLAVRVDV